MHGLNTIMMMNARAAAMTRPARTRPLTPRGRRALGWMGDDALARLKAELLAMPGGPSKTAREVVAKIESEQAERRLDPKPTKEGLS